jgi:[NiFe] hydrogenase assembly HybE family chaperone
MSGGARECGVCWYVYRPDDGDDVWQVPPGTAFDALPDEWRCPRCDSPKEKFLPLAPSPSGERAGERGNDGTLAARVSALVADYQHIFTTKMKDLPLNNPRLSVEAVDFQPLAGGALGALVTPWAINAVFLPPPGAPVPSARGHERALPAAVITFLPQKLPTAGDVELASLFSPAQEFEDQAAAVATAREALALLRTAPSPSPPEAHSRRELFDALRGRRSGPPTP